MPSENVLKTTGNLFDSSVTSTVLHNFYVDDCLKSVSSEDEAVLLCRNLKAIYLKGGFRLTKWISNSRGVLAAIPEKEMPKELKDLDLDQDLLPIERALGIQWCVESDQFKFRIAIQDKPPTRRNILSLVSSVYDPLGFLAPVVLPAKKTLQELCRLKLSWDDIIPDHFAQRWGEWIEDLQFLTDFGVDRCFKPAHFGEATTHAQLHHFCDASEEGYGTVTYLVQRDSKGHVHSAFVMGKARVAPLKPTTIPRLELTAATLAVRMDTLTRKELELQLANSTFWTDSAAVLKYINNKTTRSRTFVANRVAEILKVSIGSQWRYVSTRVNPADYASRGQKVISFVQNQAWISGPDFLTQSSDNWPENPDRLTDPNAVDPEIKKDAFINILAAEEKVDVIEATSKVLDPQRQ